MSNFAMYIYTADAHDKMTQEWVGGDHAHRSFFLRDAMRCTRNCPSYIPDIPVLITYASNYSGTDEPVQLYTIARALAAYAYTELRRT